MSTIIAGRYAELAHANHAVESLAESGFPADRIASFFVTPAGQHDMHGQGHDLDDSAGAQNAGTGAVAGAGAGAGAGAVVGLAAAPFLGPAGPIAGAAVGAYVGSLHGTLNQLDEGKQDEPGSDDDTAEPKHEPAPRKSGFVVAVATEGNDARAVDVLDATGAIDIERASGTIANGKWDDFDPVAAPDLIAPRRPNTSYSADPNTPRLLTPR
jgi:phage tail tape-measure protein